MAALLFRTTEIILPAFSRFYCRAMVHHLWNCILMLVLGFAVGNEDVLPMFKEEHFLNVFCSMTQVLPTKEGLFPLQLCPLWILW